MKLYTTLFRRLMAPADDTGSAGAAAIDRGDDFTPTEGEETTPTEPAEAAKAAPDEEKPEEETPRGPDGKFTKKEREDNGPLIPKARFDEQLGKERQRAEAAERRAAELEKAAAQVTRNLDLDKAVADVAALRQQERKALLDGDEEKAAALSTQADRLNRQIAIAESNSMTDQAKDQALEDMRMELTIERMEEKYPMLRQDHESYDQDLIDDILDKQVGLINRQRMAPSKALAKAVELVMSRQAPEPAAEKTGLSAAQASESRKTAAVAKNIDAAARQPGSLSEVGMDSDKAGQTKTLPAVSAMTYEEFNALPETTRAKMRGDFV